MHSLSLEGKSIAFTLSALRHGTGHQQGSPVLTPSSVFPCSCAVRGSMNAMLRKHSPPKQCKGRGPEAFCPWSRDCVYYRPTCYRNGGKKTFLSIRNLVAVGIKNEGKVIILTKKHFLSYLPPSWPYLTLPDCFLPKECVVTTMLLRPLTNPANDLLVLLTEEEEFLSMVYTEISLFPNVRVQLDFPESLHYLSQMLISL